MAKRTSIKQVLEIAELLRSEGHDIRIPLPKDRPLIVLVYCASETPNPKILRFKTLREAYESLERMWRESLEGTD